MVVDFSSWVSEDGGSNHVEDIVPTISGTKVSLYSGVF